MPSTDTDNPIQSYELHIATNRYREGQGNVAWETTKSFKPP